MTNYPAFNDFIGADGALDLHAYYRTLDALYEIIEATNPAWDAPVRVALEQLALGYDLHGWRQKVAREKAQKAELAAIAAKNTSEHGVDVVGVLEDMLHMELRNASHKADARVRQKLQAFANICREVQSLSYDEKRKVGAIVFRKDFSAIASIGYNGNYAGGPNERDSMARGGSGYIHAEVNAIMKAGITPDNADKFVLMGTLSPCANCAKIIANSGIRRVLFLEIYEADTSYVEIFRNSGVDYHLLPDDVGPSLSTSIRYMLEK